METNDLGQVALRYHQPVQKYIRLGNGHEYLFVVRANISLSWVDATDSEQILSIKRNDCSSCGNKPVFRTCSETDVRRWTNGGGR